MTAPTPPKDAATVVVLREGQRGLELFCVRRSSRSGFMAGAVVFPGGKVDRADASGQWATLSTPLSERARTLGQDEEQARAFAVAGLRETLEEAAILPVAGGRLDAGEALALRQELTRATAVSGGLAPLLSARGLRLDLTRLEALSRWITPTAEPRRYDTRFYLLPLPDGQQGAHDRHETTHSFWATPEEILSRWSAGEIFLAPPTSCTIELFVGAESVASTLEIARRHPLDAICPAFVRDGNATILTLPGDPLHPEPAAARAPTDVTRFELEGSRFVARRALRA